MKREPEVIRGRCGCTVRFAALVLLVTVMAAGTAWADSPTVVAGMAPGSQTVQGPEEAGTVKTAADGGMAPVTDAGGAASPVIQAGGGLEASVPGNGQTAGSQAEQSPVILVGPGGQTDRPEAQPPEGVQEAESGQTAGDEDSTVSETGQTQSAGRNIDPSRPMVALTYDDGPQTDVGNRIMDCLAQYGGKATFFMVGERVAARAAEVQRMVAEGHEVANHTMNHKYLQKQSAAVIQAQVSQCNDAIQAACGVRPSLLRLPGGNHNSTVLANTGMPMIQWSIDTLDWKHRNAATTVSTVLNQVKDGDIILMHELYSATADATEQIVPELVNRGYQLVTVSELAAAKGQTLSAGQLYLSIR